MRGAWVLIALLTGPALSAQEEGTPFDQKRCVELLLETMLPKSTSATEQEGEARQGRIEEDQETCTVGSGGGCVFPAPEVAVLAGEKDGRAVLRYSAEQNAPSDKTSWAFEATVPFDAEDKEGVFASLKEVNGDITLAAEAAVVSWRPFVIARYAAALCSACEEAKVPTLQGCFPEALPEILKKSALTAREVKQRLRTVNDAGFGQLVGTAFGGNVMLGRAQREFFTTDAKLAEDDRIGYAVGVNGTFFLRNGLIAFELLEKRDFEEAKTATLCTPVATGSLLEECQTKPRSRATAADSFVAGVEWKIALQRLALVPQLQHDFDKSLWAAQLPIYLVRNDKGKLTGGLRIGWRSDTDEVTAALFVAQPLAF